MAVHGQVPGSGAGEGVRLLRTQIFCTAELENLAAVPLPAHLSRFADLSQWSSEMKACQLHH